MWEFIIGYGFGCASVGAIWLFRAQIKAEYERELAALHGKVDQLIDTVAKKIPGPK